MVSIASLLNPAAPGDTSPFTYSSLMDTGELTPDKSLELMCDASNAVGQANFPKILTCKTTLVIPNKDVTPKEKANLLSQSAYIAAYNLLYSKHLTKYGRFVHFTITASPADGANGKKWSICFLLEGYAKIQDVVGRVKQEDKLKAEGKISVQCCTFFNYDNMAKKKCALAVLKAAETLFHRLLSNDAAQEAHIHFTALVPPVESTEPMRVRLTY